MRPIAESIRRFLVSEEGPTAVEYAVMLAMIILVCLIGIQALGSATNSTFTNVSGKMSGS
jgi:pilus assembly protein Flp/PilA